MATTGSPTKRTTSVASHGRVIAALNMGIVGGNGSRSTSAPVYTATTPGAFRASSTSIDVIRACAIVERT